MYDNNNIAMARIGALYFFDETRARSPLTADRAARTTNYRTLCIHVCVGVFYFTQYTAADMGKGPGILCFFSVTFENRFTSREPKNSRTEEPA